MNRSLLVRAGIALGIGLWMVWPTNCRAGKQPALPDELAIMDGIVLTDGDECYVSPSVQFFKLPDEKRLTLATEAAYGLTDQLEVSAEVPYAFLNPAHSRSVNGFGDVEIAGLYGVMDYRENPFGLNVGSKLELPTGSHSKDLGDGRVAVEPFFTASQWFRRVNVQVNFGWHRAVSHAGDEPENEYDYNVALIYPVHQLFLVLEGNGATNSDETKYYVTPGLTWKASEHLQFQLAAPIGVTGAAGDYGVVAGCTIEFEHLFHRRAEKE